MGYLLLFNEKGNALSWYKLDYGDYAEIAGCLENPPVGYASHRIVTREEVAEEFDLEDDD